MKKESNTVNCSHHCPLFNIIAPQQCGFAPSCSLFEEMCVFPTNKTCDPPKGATYKYQISGYRELFLLPNVTIFGGLSGAKCWKTWIIYFFSCEAPTSFILYCVYRRSRSLYTVTLSPRIASAIQTKHQKFKQDLPMCMVTLGEKKDKPAPHLQKMLM